MRRGAAYGDLPHTGVRRRREPIVPSWFWIGLWVVAIGVVAVLYVREKRSGRRIGEGEV